VASLALHPDNEILQFKGGTALRLCHFAEYRYSADIDLNRVSDTSDDQVGQLMREVLAVTRDRVGLPHLELLEGPPLRIAFIGPKRTSKPSLIKLDITGDELSTGADARSVLLKRYEDQPDTPPLRVYSLDEAAAEKLRSIMQRLQCRDLFDTWYLLEHAGVDAAEIRLQFEAKTSHRGFDPARFPNRFETRVEEYRRRWVTELSPYLSDVPDVDRVIREVSRRLRQAGYL